MKSALLGGSILCLMPLTGLYAQTADTRDETEAPAQPEQIVVYGRGLPQIGIALSGSQGTVGYADIANRPIGRTGELVENVPGVIATQHSGTGKANQYFLRGFNLDHGTDFAGFVDGVPINMRTHGHGQGYLDLNFVIPELVERIDYRKGPYFADTGDFSAAGTVSFTTYDRLTPFVDLTVGSYGYYRGLAAGSLTAGDGDLLVALEGTLSNGPWVLDENLEKVNGVIRYSHGDDDSGWDVQATGYRATWTATDQIPQRAVDSGQIDRFGFIDPDLGGETTRLSTVANANFGGTRLNAYAIYYDFVLTSNFTYFLEDPVNGDQFQQRDRREIFGGSASHRFDTTLGSIPLALRIGGDTRYDHIENVGLYDSVAGIRTNTIRQDQVDEFSAALYADAEFSLTPRLRATLGLRGDYYGYDVNSDLNANSGDGSDAILGPKFAIAWRPIDGLEFYGNYGESFHSNDVRGATITIDPATGAPADQVDALVRARGGEIGGRVETGGFTASIVAFYLELGSELVFVGDAGATEPNDASRRYGTEATAFWRPVPWLALDGSIALTHARFRGVPAGLDRIPNSVDNVIAAGATLDFGQGFSGALRVRHFGEAPLIEDGSARSEPTTLVNLGAYYEFSRVRIGFDLLNVFGARDNDITYFYASRLPGEPAGGVEDFHFHPVEPRQVRVSARLSF